MPPIRSPAKARVISSVDQLGAKAPAMVKTAEQSIETKMTSRRPNPSAKAAASRIATARLKVATDMASELCVALTWK